MQEWLVCVDASEESFRRVQQSAAFAKATGATCRALVVTATPRGAFDLGADVMLAAMRDHWEALRSQGNAFQKRCKSEAGVHADVLHTAPDRVIVDTASVMRPCDLVICNQPQLDRAFIDDDLFEAALFVSGRPALVLPRDFTGPLRGKRILIAWKNCREAARAIHDALPFLIQAESVTVLSVKETQDDLAIGREALERMAQALRDRDVKIETRAIIASKDNVAKTILQEAQSADMLVMGGYGHWRWSEILFGGVTRHVLQAMQVPVFMSR